MHNEIDRSKYSHSEYATHAWQLGGGGGGRSRERGGRGRGREGEEEAVGGGMGIVVPLLYMGNTAGGELGIVVPPKGGYPVSRCPTLLLQCFPKQGYHAAQPSSYSISPKEGTVFMLIKRYNKSKLTIVELEIPGNEFVLLDWMDRCNG